MSSGLQEARRLIQHRGDHRVISLYLDLDPEQFATGPARASQIRSLLDEGHRIVDALDGLGHEDKVALREDLKRIDAFLSSPDAPFKGTRSLALFCSSLDDLFEVVRLARPAPARVVIESTPYVEPMVVALESQQWLVALVNRRTARLLAGSPERLRERERRDNSVRAQTEVGGWSQANYERSAEEDALNHLRGVAEDVNRRKQRVRGHDRQPRRARNQRGAPDRLPSLRTPDRCHQRERGRRNHEQARDAREHRESRAQTDDDDPSSRRVPARVEHCQRGEDRCEGGGHVDAVDMADAEHKWVGEPQQPRHETGVATE